MLSQERARRLAERAKRRRRGGSRTWLARRAWRALAAAGDHGEDPAIAEAWRLWLGELRSPRPGSGADGEVTEALARWGLPSSIAKEVFAAGMSRYTGRTAIGSLCARLGVAPADPVHRALFYLLTGQAAQHRAADPDGTLLASGYRTADPAVRAAIREAIAGSGHLDLIRILVSDRAPGQITLQERDYLIGQLTGRRDWAGLWRVVRALPLAPAVAAVRHFPGRWHPGDPDGRELLGLLRRADPGQIGTARDALTTPRTVRIGEDDWVSRCVFNADGSRLAVWSGSPTNWSVFALPSGTLHRTCPLPTGMHEISPVMALDDVMFGLTERRGSGSDIVADWGTGTLQVIRPDLRPGQLLAYPGGFVAERWLDTGADGDTELVFCDAYGRTIHAVTLGRDLGIQHRPSLCAVDNDSGRLAVCSDDRLWLLDRHAERVLASAPLPRPSFKHNPCFYDPERLVTIGRFNDVSLWQYTGTGLELRATAPRRGHILAVFPARGEIAMVEESYTYRHHYLDARTLTEITPPLARYPNPVTRMWAGPDGRSYVMRYDGVGRLDYVADKYPAKAVALADRPLAELTLVDFATVTAALRYDGPPEPRPFLELLLACLEHQFGTEVTLAAAPPAAGPDDIALSPPAPAELPEDADYR